MTIQWVSAIKNPALRNRASTFSFLKRELQSQFFNVAAMNHCTQKEYFPMLKPFSYEEIIAIPLYTPRLVGNRSASVLSLIQQPLSWMAWRSAMLGVTCVLGSSAPVSGLVLFPSANQLSISARSYVCPSAVITGSRITSIVNGQWKESI